VSSVEALSTIKSSASPVICGRTLQTAFPRKDARLRVQIATVINTPVGMGEVGTGLLSVSGAFTIFSCFFVANTDF
jgi:hypothetical protein